MSEEDSISIIIVNYNSGEFLKSCLQSIVEANCPALLEVIVIDNGSKDGSENNVTSFHLPVIFCKNEKNIGLSKGNNQGIKMSRGKFLLFLNPDTVIPTGSLEKLLDFMKKHPDTGIAGPKLLNPDGSLQYSCREFYTLSTILLRRSIFGSLPFGKEKIRKHLMQDWNHSEIKEVDWILGACLFVRREAIEEVGMMDERFFLYFEDVDWCYRMKRKGWKVFYYPEVEIFHHYRRHSAKKGYREAREFHLGSMLKFISKYGGLLGGKMKEDVREEKGVRFKWKRILWHRIFKLIYISMDIILIIIFFWLTYIFRLILGPYAILDYDRYFSLFLLTLISYFFINLLSGLYRNCYRMPLHNQLILTIQNVLFSAFFVLSVLFLFRGFAYSRLFLVMLWILIFSSSILERIFLYKFNLSCIEKGYGRRRTLIIGEGIWAKELYERLLENPELGCEVVGFLSKQTKSSEWKYGGVSVFGMEQPLSNIFINNKIDQILIPNLEQKAEDYLKIVEDCKKANVDLRIVSARIDILASQAKIFDITGISLVGKETHLRWGFNKTLKRSFDLIFSLILFVILLPVFFFVFLFVKISVNGSAFLSERRIGRNGKIFQMFKFSIPKFSLLRDTIQRFRLDEIPSLMNVIRGDMSLVGPRPSLEHENSKYKDWHKGRLEVPQGVTGLWQVRKTADLSFDEMVLLDLYYVENWSFLLDIEILIETLPSLLLGQKK